MHQSPWLTWLSVVLLAASIGCNQSSSTDLTSTSGGVAVIDLDRVAQQLGSDKQIVASLNEAQQTLNEKLQQLAQNYQAQIAQQSQNSSSDPASNEGVRLASFQQQAQANIAKAKNQAASQLAQRQAQLIQQFRHAVKPAARAEAQQRGLSLVITKNDSVVFDYVDAVDVTDAVVARLRGGG